MSIVQSTDSWSIFKRLFGYLSQYKLVFFIAVVGNFVFAGMDYIFVRSLEPLTNEALVKGDMDFLTFAPFFIIGVIVIRGIANFVSAYSMTWVGQNVVEQIRIQVIHHYMRLPSQFFDEHSSGKLVSKITFDTQQIASAITNAITRLLREGALIGYILFYLFSTSWKLAFLFLLATPIIGAIVNVTGKRFKKISTRIQDAMGAITQKTHEIIDGFRVIKTFNSELFELNKFSKEASHNRQQNVKMIATKSLSVAVIQFIAGIFLALVLYAAGLELADGKLSPGQFVTMLTMMMLMLKPLKIISNLNSIFQTGIAAAQSIFEIIDRERERDDGTEMLENVTGNIEFKRIGFSYSQDKGRVLDDISFVVNPGQTVALVGRSGSGKSTLANLLLRFYDSDNGDILIDGLDIKKITLKSLRQNISLVSQQVTLFNTSVAENIAYGEQGHIDLEKIKNAAIQSHAWEFIKDLPNGLNENIGENGNKLSGGQRQRIAIARALYKDSPIVILDEATSSLDSESERHIQDALDSLTKSKTTLVIAHRLTTIEKADLILVMEHGKIVEHGDHNSLIANSGIYASLHSMQFSERK